MPHITLIYPFCAPEQFDVLTKELGTLLCKLTPFDLTLTDPLADKVDSGWPGVGGDYTITIGQTSSAEPRHRGDLPVLTATVGAFTRLWFGVAPATTLAVSDPLEAPAELLEQLDDALSLPRPVPGWQF